MEPIKNQLEGVSVTAEMVDKLQDKTFRVVGFRYDTVKKFEGKEDETERKLILSVQTSEGAILDYYINKTSRDTLMANWGLNLDNWVEGKAGWYTEEHTKGKEKVKYLFIDDKLVEECDVK